MGDMSYRRSGSGSAVVGRDASVSRARGLSRAPFLQLIEFIQLFAFAQRPAEHKENRLVQAHICAPSSCRIVTEVLFALSLVLPARKLFFL